ncbi:hypothetical protein SIXOD_v1c07800 [Spiroplasma ixodetis Y32]|nr:hypothetical protein SIXOD_v1c07800 [Spiroplasma ixodetis Y32]
MVLREKFLKILLVNNGQNFFTTNCFYRFVPTARLTRKTWNCLAFDLFVCCNFSDSSVQEVRRYENTHSETTIGALMNVCQVLLEKYDINLGFSPFMYYF